MCVRKWYYYTGNGDDTNPINYICVPGLDPSMVCPGGPRICAVLSCPNTVNPRIPAPFTENLLNYMIIAKAIQWYYPLPPDKPYVYTQPWI